VLDSQQPAERVHEVILGISTGTKAKIWLIRQRLAAHEHKLDRSFPALSRYEFERTPEVVIVGRSMAYRLYEGYFGVPLRNLSIDGGSPISGVAFDTTHRTPSSEGNPKVSRKNLTEPSPRSGKLIRTSSEVSRISPTVFSPWL
jgi:hypothetical protein